MALGDELARSDTTTIEGPMSISDIGTDVDVANATEPLGDQTGGRTAEKVEVASPTGRIARAARTEAGEVPPDDGRTPPGAASPEEGRNLGDAVKNVFDALETPGAREALRQMGLDIRGASGEIEGFSGDQIARAEEQAGVDPGEPASAANQDQSLFSRFGEMMQNRDLQRGLIALGSEIDPEGRGPLGEAGSRMISSDARAEYRERLNRGESPSAAAQRTEGLTPEGQQSVLQSFRAERQRRFEREQTETQVEQEGEFTDAQIKQIRAEIRQGDRRLDQTEEEIDQAEERLNLRKEELGIQRDRLGLESLRIGLAEREQDLQEEVSSVERGLTEAQTRLTEARADEVGEGEDPQNFIESQLKRANEVAQTATTVSEQVRSELETVRMDLEGTQNALPTDSSDWPFTGTNVRSAFQEIRQEAQQVADNSEDLSFSEAVDRVAENQISSVPQENRGDLRRALQLEAERQGLNSQLRDLQDTRDQANQIVINAFQSGEARTEPTETSQGSEADQPPSFESPEEVSQAINEGRVTTGQVVSVNGSARRVVKLDNGNLGLEPIE